MPELYPASQITLENLLGHFDMPYDVKTIASYTSGDVNVYQVTFYLGNTWDNTLPTVFLNDVLVTNSRVVWMNYNLWKLAWDYQSAFESRFGFRYKTTAATGAYNKATYNGKTLVRSQDEYAQVSILDAAKAKALAFITNGTEKYPYVVQSGNFYFVADDPMSQGAEDSVYLAFCDLLHDMVGVSHAASHKALVRIEDIDATEDPVKIRAIADYLYSQNVPFSLAIIPRFADPLGAWGPPMFKDINESPDLVSALNYAVARGGTIVMHGYTHQYGSVANPTNGVSGVDSEFYIQSVDGAGDIANVSPVLEDSILWVQNRIDSGAAVLGRAGFPRPLIFETPHYLASELDYQVFSSNFSSLYQRLTDTYFPYVINKSVYGSRIIPENLGYIDPASDTPQVLINRADKDLVIRDGFASFFYHSEVNISYLKTTIAGIKAKGYTFVDVNSLITTADTTAPVVTASNVTVEATGPSTEVTPTATATDLVDGSVTASCPSGSYPVGSATVTCSAKDAAGNTGTAVATITVTDTIAPVITASNVTVEATGPSTEVTPTATATDLVDGSVTASCPSGSYPVGSATVTCSAKDAAGNTGTAVATITVTDTTAPVVSNMLPSGTIMTSSPTLNADLADGTGVGIDTAAVVVYLDSSVTPLAGCTVTTSHVSCPATVTTGDHTFKVYASDKLGQTTNQTSSIFTLTQINYYWTWYDNVNADNWILAANPESAAADVYIDMSVAETPQPLADNGRVAPGGIITPKFAGLMDGPVKATSTTGGNAILSQRTLWPKGGNSLEEVLAVNETDLSDHFWWTWYDENSPGYRDWVLIANTGPDPVRAEIRIAGNLMTDAATGEQYFVIAPGEEATPDFPGVIGGPVEVRAYLATGTWPADARDVMASQRVLSNNGAAFNEVPGIADNDLTTDYLWTWYDSIGSAGMDWVLVANPGPGTVRAEVRIAGNLMTDSATGQQYFDIGPGQTVTPQFAGVIDGPVRVTATGGNIIASQRVTWGPSFEEVPGYPYAALTNTYHWTWYDQSAAGVSNWVMVSKQDFASTTVFYKVLVAGVERQTCTQIPAAGRDTPAFPSIIGGPVEVQSYSDAGCTVPSAPGNGIMASQRVLWKGNFNEVLGTALP